MEKLLEKNLFTFLWKNILKDTFILYFFCLLSKTMASTSSESSLIDLPKSHIMVCKVESTHELLGITIVYCLNFSCCGGPSKSKWIKNPCVSGLTLNFYKFKADLLARVVLKYTIKIKI